MIELPSELVLYRSSVVCRQRKRDNERKCIGCVSEIHFTTHKTIRAQPALKSIAQSNYLKIYKEVGRDSPLKFVCNRLPPKVALKLKRFYQEEKGDIKKAVVKLWTDEETKTYKRVQKAIAQDHKDSLRSWMPYIRVLNDYIVGKSDDIKQDEIVYRKSNMEEKTFQKCKFSEKQLYRIARYVATSQDENIWKTHQTSNSGLGLHRRCHWMFKLKAGCMQVASISDISLFKSEKEWLLVPYSVVRIDEIRTHTVQNPQSQSVTEIHATVLQDSRSHSDDLPSIDA